MQKIQDPIFGQRVTFYLFTLPAWELLATWLTTLAFIGCGMAVLFLVVTGGLRVFTPGGADHPSPCGASSPWRRSSW